MNAGMTLWPGLGLRFRLWGVNPYNLAIILLIVGKFRAFEENFGMWLPFVAPRSSLQQEVVL